MAWQFSKVVNTVQISPFGDLRRQKFKTFIRVREVNVDQKEGNCSFLRPARFPNNFCITVASSILVNVQLNTWLTWSFRSSERARRRPTSRNISYFFLSGVRSL